MTNYTSTGIVNGEIGTVVASHLLYYTTQNSHVVTTSTSYENSGVAGSFVTKQSSTDSRLEFDIASGMAHSVASSIGQTTICLKASNNTTYYEADDLWDKNAHYRMYQTAGASHFNWFMKWHYSPSYHSDVCPANLTSFSAGQTVYWTMFMRCSNSSYGWFPLHSGSCLSVSVKEIQVS